MTSWTKDAFLNKSKGYVARAHEDRARGETFGLWYALALEHLLKAALSATNPVFVADPKHEESLLHATGIMDSKRPKTASSETLLNRSIAVIKDFEPRHRSIYEQMMRWRNEELHSGGEPFRNLQPNAWLVEYYVACGVLLRHLSMTLEELFGPEEAVGATKMIDAAEKRSVAHVRTLIKAARDAFNALPVNAQSAAKQDAEQFSMYQTHAFDASKVCPACGATGILHRQPFKEYEDRLEDGLVYREYAVLPTGFACACCKLTLKTPADVAAQEWGEPEIVSVEVEPTYFYDEDGEPDEDDWR